MTWLDLLETAVASRGQNAVARELGYSPTTLSLVRRGRYPGATHRIEARILQILGDVACPFLNQTISAGQCRRTSLAPVPTSNPRALQHWSACQSCPHFPGDRP